ncbi:hypothetical protein EYF80_025896 [Liparis tanakae]|uniref:Uncharacterized protein n=1 Tax=Liparis tanakae TaxID=230148 RepID=A0A4Z2HGD8_9TELE|nr:hypothetical protein EYF80_025896 [Liparis tanakae]
MVVFQDRYKAARSKQAGSAMGGQLVAGGSDVNAENNLALPMATPPRGAQLRQSDVRAGIGALPCCAQTHLRTQGLRISFQQQSSHVTDEMQEQDTSN